MLPREIELCAVQFPGREGRLGEPPLTRWEDVIESIGRALAPWMVDPFILFGHSLGALVAYEIARRACSDRSRTLVHLFVSACRAPHLPFEGSLIHDLPRSAFVTALSGMGGTPLEVLQCPELLEQFLPALRADFKLWESYTYQSSPPLTAPISIYGGSEDPLVTVPTLQAWRCHTSFTFRHAMFHGGHFFLKEQRAAVLTELALDLRVRNRIASCGGSATF
jgi:medium-chain acyl-[acyl-carrier-protein] hydrolase